MAKFGFVLVVASILSGCTFFNGGEAPTQGVDQTRLKVYKQVANTACIQFGLDMLTRKSQWKPQAKEKPAIFSKEADREMPRLSDKLIESVDNAPTVADRDQAERAYLTEMTGFLEKTAPNYVELCQGLTRVYIQCDKFNGDRRKQNRCVAHEQREVLKRINAYLVRNFHPSAKTSSVR